MLAFITGGYKTTAKVIDNALVLSFPDAIKPGLWRLSLDDAKECVFEIQEAGGVYYLYNPEKKKKIAGYNKRSKAVQAMLKAGRALSRKKGGGVSGFIKFIFKAALFIIFIAALLYVASLFLSPALEKTSYVQPAPPMEQQAQQPQPKSTAGLPISADDFLEGFEEK